MSCGNCTELFDKSVRENWEINEFLKVYAGIHRECSPRIEKKRDKPDYLVVNVATNKKFYVELTEVYLSDRSVPDEHKPALKGLVSPPGNIQFNQAYRDKFELYKTRLIEAVRDKICKARKGYSTCFPLILSVYKNEYLYVENCEIKELVRCNQALFDDMDPFDEVVFWNLSWGGAVSVYAHSQILSILK